MKNEVSVIGLGAMGSALAREHLRNGHCVTVWNGTSAKAEPLIRDGAALAPSPALAVGASPIVVVCVDDYEVTNTILDKKEVAPALAGRVLVQLSTGSPQDARQTSAPRRREVVATATKLSNPLRRPQRYRTGGLPAEAREESQIPGVLCCP